MNKLLDLFDLKNYSELKEFIKDNPNDDRVIELLAIIDKLKEDEKNE